jgi:hypothetical protein
MESVSRIRPTDSLWLLQPHFIEKSFRPSRDSLSVGDADGCGTGALKSVQKQVLKPTETDIKPTWK